MNRFETEIGIADVALALLVREPKVSREKFIVKISPPLRSPQYRCGGFLQTMIFKRRLHEYYSRTGR